MNETAQTYIGANSKMTVKNGVSLAGMKPEILVAAMVCERVVTNAGYTFTLTSVTDGEHMKGSKHYEGLAIDFRTRMMPSNVKSRIAKECRNRLSKEFDVVEEATHIHVEYDPK